MINEIVDASSGWHYDVAVLLVSAPCKIEYRSCSNPHLDDPCEDTGVEDEFTCPNPIQPPGPETCP